MKISEIKHLFYIALIKNVPSILKEGILCHNLAEKIDHESIALEGVQERRRNRVIPNGGRLHDYANLYINPRNPMMYLRKERHQELCVIVVNNQILNESGVVVSDRNTAKQNARFEPPEQGLALINKERVFAKYWTHNDPLEEERHRGEMCAEVLVPNRVDPKYILGVYVSCPESQAELNRLCPECKTKINADYFFA